MCLWWGRWSGKASLTPISRKKEKFELIDKRGKHNNHSIPSSKIVNDVDFISPKADLHSFHTKSHLIFAQNLGISILHGLCHVPCEMSIEHLPIHCARVWRTNCIHDSAPILEESAIWWQAVCLLVDRDWRQDRWR